ncbi:MAG: helix-hairpin-helix domain-containing protein, partial [Anaerolineae bacterium]|nr:helix-hairpin-helix domain-containing protein [Anaerolineae bacterium]
LSAVDQQRVFRLYQSSFLLRDYGWDAEDFSFLGEGYLPTDKDPKIAWADVHLKHQPVELMTADRETLLRVPGIGLKAAAAILRARQHTHFTDLHQLRRLGIRAPERAAPYVLLSGKRSPAQMKLF